jgi:hypothetical protein
MKLTVANTRSNDPEVHAEGCNDVKRGLKTGKYVETRTIEVAELDGAAAWFWADFLPGGCAYGETEPGMTIEDAVGYTEFLPCTAKKEGSKMTTTVHKTRPAAKTGDPVADKEAAKAPRSGRNRTSRAADQAAKDPKAGQTLGTGPKAAKSEPLAESAKADKAAKAPKAAKPKDPTKLSADQRRALATALVDAAASIVPGEGEGWPASANGLQDIDRDVAAKIVANWLHHLPNDRSAWPKHLPTPDRSSWR